MGGATIRATSARAVARTDGVYYRADGAVDDGRIYAPHGIVVVTQFRAGRHPAAFLMACARGVRYTRMVSRRRPYTRRGLVQLAARFARDVAGSAR